MGLIFHQVKSHVSVSNLMWFCVFSSRESHFVVFPLSDIQNFRFAFSNSTNYFLKSVINDCIYLWIEVTLTNGCNYCEVAFILGCHLLLSKERLKSIYMLFSCLLLCHWLGSIYWNTSDYSFLYFRLLYRCYRYFTSM